VSFRVRVSSWEWVSGGLKELFFNRVERVETCRTAVNFSPSPPLHGYKSLNFSVHFHEPPLLNYAIISDM
jgi:hypothetical protein